MAIALRDRASKEANATLHRLLDHQKTKLGVGRVEPEQFFPVDAKAIVQLLGWTLEQVSSVGHAANGDPLAAKCVKAEKKILLLSTLPDDAKRFTLAHELAHVCLHTNIPDCNGGNNLPRVLSMLSASKRHQGTEYSDIEREAEVYARELLMPERAIRRHFHHLFSTDQLRASSALAAKFAPRSHKTWPINPRAVADEIANWTTTSRPSMTQFFGVSTRAMAGRLLGLHLIY
jgi:Zn-dependent peptidase ImmA (M78 family)